MIPNQAGARLAPLGNFYNIARCPVGHQVLLLKIPKDTRPAPDGFSNLWVSATPNHKKSSYILRFRVHPPWHQTIVPRPKQLSIQKQCSFVFSQNLHEMIFSQDRALSNPCGSYFLLS